MGPHRSQTVDARERHAGHHRHAFARHQIGDDPGDRRAYRQPGLYPAARFDQPNLLVVHANLAHACARRIHQRIQVAAPHAAQRQEVLLRRHPVRHIEVDQRLALGHAIERRAYVQLFDVAHRAGLHDHLVAFVPGNRTHRRHRRRERALGDRRGAQTDVLLDARADGDGTGIRAFGTGIGGYQHHVHEGRLARRFELLSGHHRVVIVEDFLPGERVKHTGLEAVLDVAARSGFAFGDAPGRRIDSRVCGGLVTRRRGGCGHGHRALRAQAVQAEARGA